MSLLELQRNFQQHLLSGDAAIVGSVVDAPPVSPADRLRIYRNAYRVRLLDALHETYPVLFKVLGDEMFESLGRGFIEAHPSVHRSIRWYGRELADHLAAREPYCEQPILSELARFEWTLSEVFDAADSPALDREALRAVEPDSWERLAFVFHPSLRRLTLGWNTVAVWQAMSRDEEPPQPERSVSPVPWLLWRRDLVNRFRSLDDAENAALEAAHLGRSFGEVCDLLRHWLPEEEIALRAATLIGTWTESGMVTAAAPVADRP